MTLGDRNGRTSSRSEAAAEPTTGGGPSQRQGQRREPQTQGDDAARPAFGPCPPLADAAGRDFAADTAHHTAVGPTLAQPLRWRATDTPLSAGTEAVPYAGPDAATRGNPTPSDNGRHPVPEGDRHSHGPGTERAGVTGPDGAATTEHWPPPEEFWRAPDARPTAEPGPAAFTEPGPRDEPPIDPFADAPDPPWVTPPAEHPPEPPEDSSGPADQGRGGAEPDQGPGRADDEVLPPRGEEERRGTDPALQVVATLLPANVLRLPAGPTRPAGKPPEGALVAAVLSGLLAVPMLASAGALFATSDGMSVVVFPAVALLLAAGCVIGGIRMIQRGSPLLPLLHAAITLVVTGVELYDRATPGVAGAMRTAIWVVFSFVALVMIGMLRMRRTRRWLSARSREWQAQRPPRRRRWWWLLRHRLPDLPSPDVLRRLGRRIRRPGTRRPQRVRKAGRHVRSRRGPGLFRRRGPVSYVGRDAPNSERGRGTH